MNCCFLFLERFARAPVSFVDSGNYFEQSCVISTLTTANMLSVLANKVGIKKVLSSEAFVSAVTRCVGMLLLQ